MFYCNYTDPNLYICFLDIIIGVYFIIDAEALCALVHALLLNFWIGLDERHSVIINIMD